MEKYIFEVDTIGDWGGYEEEVAKELNERFHFVAHTAVGNYYFGEDIEEGVESEKAAWHKDAVSWDDICAHYEKYLSPELVAKINKI